MKQKMRKAWGTKNGTKERKKREKEEKKEGKDIFKDEVDIKEGEMKKQNKIKVDT